MQTTKINWNIPHGLSILTPQIVEYILKINMSFDNITSYEVIWTGFANGDLSFKDSYNYIKIDRIKPS